MTTETDEHAMAPRLYETAVAHTRQRLAAVSRTSGTLPPHAPNGTSATSSPIS